MIFGEHRAGEFQRRLRRELCAIAAAGGGIRATARHESEREGRAREDAVGAARALARNGCTTVEVKSGYGLSPRGRSSAGTDPWRDPAGADAGAAHRAAAARAAEEYRARRAEYIQEMCGRVLSEIQIRGLAGGRRFLRPGGVQGEECRAVLERAGSWVRDQIHADSSSAAAAPLAPSLERFRRITRVRHAEDWQALGRADVVGVLLPGSALTLGPEAAEGQDAA